MDGDHTLPFSKRWLCSILKLHRTALHVAGEAGDADAALCLLSAGADPSVTDNLGRKPVDVAKMEAKTLLHRLECTNSSHEKYSLRGCIVSTTSRISNLWKGMNSQSYESYLRKLMEAAQIPVTVQKFRRVQDAGGLQIISRIPFEPMSCSTIKVLQQSRRHGAWEFSKFHAWVSTHNQSEFDRT